MTQFKHSLQQARDRNAGIKPDMPKGWQSEFTQLVELGDDICKGASLPSGSISPLIVRSEQVVKIDIDSTRQLILTLRPDDTSLYIVFKGFIREGVHHHHKIVTGSFEVFARWAAETIAQFEYQPPRGFQSPEEKPDIEEPEGRTRIIDLD